VNELAELVGLDPGALGRRTRELSGGQLKRLSLARALGVDPRVLILDEPFTGLDVSLQAQIANLLTDVQAERQLTCLYISHDLTMVSHLADEVAVLDKGRMVERGPVEQVLRAPRANATRALIEASRRFTLSEPPG
jgi:ABC-type dipeptide/oligopeptide/nickel transport system ATPase subunit